MYPRVGEKRRIDEINIEDEEAIGTLCRLSGRPVSPKSAMEQEKRIRREIANSNERRRMQSINAGFASLKTLLPHHEGEKLSKAAILQQTAEYIYQLEQEKTTLLSQNCQLKRLLNQQHVSDPEGSPTGAESPCNDDRTVMCTVTTTPSPPLCTTVSSNNNNNNHHQVTQQQHQDEFGGSEIMETRVYLDRDRKHRVKVQKHQIRSLESSDVIYSDHIIKDSSHKQMNMEYRPSEKKVKLELRDDHISTEFVPLTEISAIEAASSTISAGAVNNHLNTVAVSASGEILQHHHVSMTKPALKVSSVPAASKVIKTSAALNHHPTATVTVMPNKAKTKTLPSAMEMNDMNVDDIPVSITSSETITEESIPQLGTVFIVNSNSSQCQKSLDTICEAIRHLEGDHMFPAEVQQQQQAPATRLEEEVVMEEMYTVEESHPHSSYIERSNNSSSADSLSHLTLHMIEPQEVPLELTTQHRESSSQHSQQQPAQYSFTSSQSTPLLRHHSSRPGVIVVKQS